MASTDVLVHINMNGNEIQNVLAQRLALAPSNPRAGQFYYNTNDNTLYVYNGTTWLNALSQGTTYTNGNGITISNNQISVDFTAVVPTSRTINSKTLSSNISLDATDVGALPSTTTINDLTSTAQQNALNSGATTTNIGQISTNTTAISTINSKIPSEASSSNKLADKAFVNSTIQTNTANFRGNWATWATVPTNSADYPVDYAGSKVPTVNDYLVVQDASDYTEETLDGTWRFKYSGIWATDGKAGWLPEYQVNETPLTQAQLNAINSGITTSLVTQIGTNQSNIASLQNNSITASSTNTLTNKTIDADNNTISNLTTSNFKSGTVVTSIGTTGSDTTIPTEKAVRSAISNFLQTDEITNGALTPTGGVCTWTIGRSASETFQDTYVINTTTREKVVSSVAVNSTAITIKINSTSAISAGVYTAVITYSGQRQTANTEPSGGSDN